MARGSVLFVALSLACGGPQETPAVSITPLPEVDASVAVSEPLPQNVPRQVLSTGSPLAGVLDPRRAPRVAALIASEVQGLESLFASTPTNAPDRPQLLRRLAEDYVELRKSTGRDNGRRAIDRYNTLVQQYPSYPQLDEVFYFLALEYEATQQLSEARKMYYELIKQRPSSKLVPAAYFAFGEMFLQEAKTDPSKWDFARQAYTEVLKFPADALRPWAMWRMGQALEQSGDSPKAQAMYTKLRAECPDSEAIAHIGEQP